MGMSEIEGEHHAADSGQQEEPEVQSEAAAQSIYLEPTQKLSDVQNFALFPD